MVLVGGAFCIETYIVSHGELSGEFSHLKRNPNAFRQIIYERVIKLKEISKDEINKLIKNKIIKNTHGGYVNVKTGGHVGHYNTVNGRHRYIEDFYAVKAKKLK